MSVFCYDAEQKGTSEQKGFQFEVVHVLDWLVSLLRMQGVSTFKGGGALPADISIETAGQTAEAVSDLLGVPDPTPVPSSGGKRPRLAASSTDADLSDGRS